MRKILICLMALALAGFGSVYGQGIGNSRDGSDKSEHETLDHAKNNASNSSSSVNIQYRGGPVMTTGAVIYYIWYGNWASNTATTILTDLAHSIGGSPYFNINTTYYQITNNQKIYVPNSVVWG